MKEYTVKDFKELLNKFDDDVIIHMDIRDEYGTEVEGVKLIGVSKGLYCVYISGSAYYEDQQQ